MSEDRTVSAEEARRMIEEGAQLVDVRADHEWEAGRISGARHLPLADLLERTGEIDKGRPAILYCRGGTRSTMAVEALAEAGYNAVKLNGGIVGWADDGLELEPEDGYVAESGEAASVLEARRRAGES